MAVPSYIRVTLMGGRDLWRSVPRREPVRDYGYRNPAGPSCSSQKVLPISSWAMHRLDVQDTPLTIKVGKWADDAQLYLRVPLLPPVISVLTVSASSRIFETRRTGGSP